MSGKPATFKDGPSSRLRAWRIQAFAINLGVASGKEEKMKTRKCSCTIDPSAFALTDRVKIVHCPLHAAASAMLEALKDCQQLFVKALPKFNWGASALDAKAIQLLNEVPDKVEQAISAAERRAT